VTPDSPQLVSLGIQETQLRPLLSLSDSELLAWLTAAGEQKFRLKQIRKWMIQRRSMK
jgi:adenine C2-methylase RlmN of 23S rRNA A2503 and tRNA A37